MTSDPVFCGDDELGYVRGRTPLPPGARLIMDESYRLAHLPLAAPGHPRAIVSRNGAPYNNGLHPRVFSLTLPIAGDALEASPPFSALLDDLRRSPFAAKIAWDLLPRRRDRLHATIAGALGHGAAAPTIEDHVRHALRAIGPFRIELRGLFSGNINVGRLYLPVFPEARDGLNPIQRIQEAFGRRPTDLYLVGLFNLTDDLDEAETAALAALLDRWRARALLRAEIDSLWLLASRDDLVLDGGVAETIPLR